MKSLKRAFFFSTWFVLPFFVGCANGPAETSKTASGVPSWVMNPMPSDPEGIADVSCVSDSGNLTVDRQAAVANARTALAQQVNMKVQAMAETYVNRTDAQGGTATGSQFEQVGRQISQQTLSGSRANKVDFVDINGKRQLCAVVELSLKQKDLFDKIVKASGAKLQPDQEVALFEQFKAGQARERMDSAIKSGQN
jgi:hypothetical protein